MPRYLSKSRFKIALECPTKLDYVGKSEYVDSKQTNDFLKALAEDQWRGALTKGKSGPKPIKEDILSYCRMLLLKDVVQPCLLLQVSDPIPK